MNNSDLSRFDPLHGGCYPGGKSGSGVYQRIINLMPPHEVYIEPFLGGGAVLRRKLPAALNIGIDADLGVIERWYAAAPHFPQAAAAAALSGDSRRRPPRSPASQDSTSPPEAPRSRATPPGCAMPDPAGKSRGGRSTRAAASDGVRLRWRFACADGIAFLRDYPWTGRELVYCDPPYLHETRRDLKLYTCELSKARHIELLEVLNSIPACVMLSGYESGLYALAPRDWHALSYSAMTRRGAVKETLWCNFSPPLELHDYRFLGRDRRERERIKRMQQSWTRRIARPGRLERQALLSVLASTVAACGDTSSLAHSASRAGALAPSAAASNSSSVPSAVSGIG